MGIIAYISTHVSDMQVRQGYFRELSQAIQRSLLQIVQNPDFLKNFQSTANREQVVNVVEMFDGLALATDETNQLIIFETCAPHFDTMIKLLDMYHNYASVQTYILIFFRDFVRHQSLDLLEKPQANLLYEKILGLVQVFAKSEIGRNNVNLKEAEMELFENLSILLQLLASLQEAGFEGFEREDVLERIASDQRESIGIAKIVFAGLNCIIPLITDALLQYPTLCLDYLNLINSITNHYPSYFSSIDVGLLHSLGQSLIFGLSKDVQIAESSLLAIQNLALYGWKHHSPNLAQLHALISQAIMEQIFFKPFDFSLLGLASNCVLIYMMTNSQVFEPVLARATTQDLALMNNEMAIVARYLDQIPEIGVAMSYLYLERDAIFNQFQAVFARFVGYTKGTVVF